MDKGKGEVIEKEEGVTVEEANEGQEGVDIDLVWGPLRHLLREVEGLDQSLVQVVMGEVEVKGA